MLKKILTNCYNSAARLNGKNILSLLEKNANAKLVDLGCDDGKWTIQIAQTIGSSKIYGIEIVNQRIEQAKKRGIKVKKADLNMKSCVTILLLAYQIIKGYFKKADFVWFFHPLACWITFWVYEWGKILGLLGAEELSQEDGKQ